MLERRWTESCGACWGTGYQRNIQTGINEKCPVCGGSGRRMRSNFDDLPPGVYCSVEATGAHGTGGDYGVMMCSQ